MKKTTIALSLSMMMSSMAIAATPSQPIEHVKPTQPIEATPSNPIEPPKPTHPIENVRPTQPIEAAPSNPIEPPKPTLPIENVRPTQPIEAAPENPIENTKPSKPIEAAPENPIEVPATPEQPIVADPDFGVTPKSNDTVRIDNLEKSFQSFAEETQRKFSELDEQMDGVRAGLHAVTNARPYVANGQFAVGAGVGFAGSKEALALGGAYGINENLSVSGTFHYETSGKYSSSEVAGGVGLQYSFN
ncbi:YadA-like family protein [Photobacterium damselae]|uniref:YadA-like family protein n=1 Tax=Photobacterium damselae TaxID=38293 RepID=UPI0040695E94